MAASPSGPRESVLLSLSLLYSCVNEGYLPSDLLSLLYSLFSSSEVYIQSLKVTIYLIILVT